MSALAEQPVALPLPHTTKEWRALMSILPGYDPWDGAIEAGMRFNEDEASRAIEFIEGLLTHAEGMLAGTPFILQPWQRAIVGNLFGWFRADGSRRYREGLIFCPRKSGKTPLLAAILLTVLVCDGEIGAQIYSAAADKEQAALLFRHAAGMVRNRASLSSIIKVYGGMTRRSLVYDAHQSVYRALSSDAKTKHGLAPSLVVVDELHAMDDRELVDTLATGMASKNRKNPLLLYITTADSDRPSICNEKIDYARKVRDGAIADLYFLPTIYEAEPDDDWTDERVWEKANPNLDVSVSREYLRAECAKAKANPELETSFRRLHLNQKTSAAIQWMPMHVWDATAGLADGETPEEWRARMIEAKRNKPCVIGLDLSECKDITATVVLFPPEEENGDWVVLPYFVVPRGNMEGREKRNGVPFTTWTRRGFMEPSEGFWVNHALILNLIEELCQTYDVREVAYDVWNCETIAQTLLGKGVQAMKVIQGPASLSEPMKRLYGFCLEKRFHHGGNPVLRWMADRVVAIKDTNGNIKPDKNKSTERIDGVSATITAMARALVVDMGGGWDFGGGPMGL